jgi:hypothetical protein
MCRPGRFRGNYQTGSASLCFFTLRRRAAWAHNTERVIGATLQTLPGACFVVNGAAQANDTAPVTGAVEMEMAERLIRRACTPSGSTVRKSLSALLIFTSMTALNVERRFLTR